MLGLAKVPTTTELASAYKKLYRGKSVNSELCLYAQWSRFDPRLAEILVAYLCTYWRTLNPLELNMRIKSHTWPAAMGVLLEHVGLLENSISLFRGWMSLVMHGVAKAPFEIFLFDTFAFGGSQMRRQAERPLLPFLRWGYLGDHLFFNKEKIKLAALKSKTLLKPDTRKVLLSQLLRTKKRLNVADYCEFLDGYIDRRQAERDLRRCKKLKPVGKTQARVYVKVSA